MADYKALLRDMRFVLNEVFEVAKLWAELPTLAETVDAETVEAILEEAGKVTSSSFNKNDMIFTANSFRRSVSDLRINCMCAGLKQGQASSDASSRFT